MVPRECLDQNQDTPLPAILTPMLMDLVPNNWLTQPALPYFSKNTVPSTKLNIDLKNISRQRIAHPSAALPQSPIFFITHFFYSAVSFTSLPYLSRYTMNRQRIQHKQTYSCVFSTVAIWIRNGQYPLAQKYYRETKHSQFITLSR